MTRLSDIISISHEYDKMFVDEKRVKVSLMELYQEIHLFIEKIRRVVVVKCEKDLLH